MDSYIIIINLLYCTYFFLYSSNNGNCYQSCTGRTILHNITHGALGSMDLSTPYNYHSYIHCLWILSVGEGFPGSSEELETYGYSSLHSMLTGAYDDSEQVTPTITLSILTNITHSCDYVSTMYLVLIVSTN